MRLKIRTYVIAVVVALACAIGAGAEPTAAPAAAAMDANWQWEIMASYPTVGSEGEAISIAQQYLAYMQGHSYPYSSAPAFCQYYFNIYGTPFGAVYLQDVELRETSYQSGEFYWWAAFGVDSCNG